MVSDLKIGMKCIKYMLFVVNLTFVITSMLLITSGGTIHAIYSDFRHFLSDAWFSPAVLMIAVGIIMFLVSAFGCWGALRESTCMINTFGAMLAAVFVVEFAGAIAAFALQNELSAVIYSKMDFAITHYHNETTSLERKEAVDFLQERLYCCGINGPEDWDPSLIPQSCCDPNYQPARLNSDGVLKMSQIEFRNGLFKNVQRGAETTEKPTTFEEQETTMDEVSTVSTTTSAPEQCIPHAKGCYKRLTFLIGSSAAILGSGATAVALMQLLGVIFAFSLARAIRKAKTQRAVRTWQQRMGHIISMQATPYTQLQEKRSMEPAPVTYAPTDPSVM